MWLLNYVVTVNVSESFLQGGPHNHTIGGLAVCLKYAQTPEFKAYQKRVLFYIYAFTGKWAIKRTLYDNHDLVCFLIVGGI